MRLLGPILILAVSCAAQSSRHSVTVLLDFQSSHSDDSLQAMRVEAQRLLVDSGIDLDVKLKGDVSPSAEFADVLVFKVTGDCEMVSKKAVNPMLYDERGVLAEAYEVDGEILSFGAIHCDPIKAMTLHLPAAKKDPRRNRAFGVALGRVLAHEAYHMLAHTTQHTQAGVTRQVLSVADLGELGPWLGTTGPGLPGEARSRLMAPIRK